MAYQLWKFGLLGQDFHYRRFTEQADGRPLWSTTSQPAERGWRAGVRPRVLGLQRHRHPAVVSAEAGEAGARGARLSRAGGAFGPLLVRDGRAVARDRARARLRHQRRQRPAVRRGLGPQGSRRQGRRSDRSAHRQGRRRSRQAQPRSRRPTTPARIAESIAIAAVRYFMVKFSRGKVIVFDIDEALSFEGESGPYLQYAVVRAQQHLQQAQGARRARRARGRRGARARRRPTVLTSGERRSARPLGPGPRGGAARRSGRSGGADAGAVGASPSTRSAWRSRSTASTTATRSSTRNAPDARIWRAAAVAYCRNQLARALGLMGCTVPARM